MAKRRYQRPALETRNGWYQIRVREDEFVGGKHHRKRKRIKLARVEAVSERTAQKLADEYLRPFNQGLVTIGSATNFRHYVQTTYQPVHMSLLASTTIDRYAGIINNYLIPAFGDLALRDLTRLRLQAYFVTLKDSPLGRESLDKLRDVLSAILSSARDNGLLVTNPAEDLRLPRRRSQWKKPYVSVEQFVQLIELIPEPYSTMVFVAVYTGLRVSELVALKWRSLGPNSLTIEERFCRGDWDVPKTESSRAVMAVSPRVIERLQRLQKLTVPVKAGHSVRQHKLVKQSGPGDLIFQSVRDGKPMRDNNILSRFIKPAARQLGLDFINWRCLRTSKATWMIEAGARPKEVQRQMRHSKIGPTLDIYAQFVDEEERRAVEQTDRMIEARVEAFEASRPPRRRIN